MRHAAYCTPAIACMAWLVLGMHIDLTLRYRAPPYAANNALRVASFSNWSSHHCKARPGGAALVLRQA